MGFPEPGVSRLSHPHPRPLQRLLPASRGPAGEGCLGLPGDPAVGAAPRRSAAQPRRQGPGLGCRCALAGEPATEGGGREGATEAGRGVGESSRAVYGLSEAADLRGGNRCSLLLPVVTAAAAAAAGSPGRERETRGGQPAPPPDGSAPPGGWPGSASRAARAEMGHSTPTPGPRAPAPRDPEPDGRPGSGDGCPGRRGSFGVDAGRGALEADGQREGGGGGWAPSPPAGSRGRCRAGQWETVGARLGGAAEEAASVSLALPPQPSQPRAGGDRAVGWEPSVP